MSIKAIAPIEKNKPEVSPKSEAVETPAPAEAFNTSQTPLSAEALLTLIATMQQQLVESQKQTAKANEALAAAIIESGRPKEAIKTKKQLADEANQKQFDDQAKELARRKKINKKLEEDSCDHIAGGSPLSEQRDIAGRTSILWHHNDVNVDVGVCTVCQRIFLPSDPPDSHGITYAQWRKKPSFNKISSSGGGRFFPDPLKAQKESYLHDIE